MRRVGTIAEIVRFRTFPFVALAADKPVGSIAVPPKNTPVHRDDQAGPLFPTTLDDGFQPVQAAFNPANHAVTFFSHFGT